MLMSLLSWRVLTLWHSVHPHQDKEDPTKFMLVEIYRDDKAPAAHKETAHYAKWRDTVADMMNTPRQAYVNTSA
jgi:quinol monooxygenase YgiN